MLDLLDKSSIWDAVDAAFDDVLDQVQLSNVAFGTQTAATNPESLANAHARGNDEWMRVQRNHASKCVQEINHKRGEETIKQTQLDAARKELFALQGKHDAESETNRSRKIKRGHVNKQRGPSGRTVVAQLTPEARERWEQAVSNAAKHRREQHERKKKLRQEERIKMEMIAAEVEKASEIRQATSKVMQLENELESIKRHTRFLEQREKRIQSLVEIQMQKNTRVVNVEKHDLHETTKAPNMSEISSTPSLPGYSVSPEHTTNASRNVAFTHQSPHMSRPKFASKRPLFKRIEQQFHENLELPEIKMRKRRLQEIHEKHTTPTKADIEKHMGEYDLNLRLAQERIAERKKKVKLDWKFNTFPMSTPSVRQATQDAITLEKKQKEDRLRRAHEHRNIQKEYGKLVRESLANGKSMKGKVLMKTRPVPSTPPGKASSRRVETQTNAGRDHEVRATRPQQLEFASAHAAHKPKWGVQQASPTAGSRTQGKHLPRAPRVPRTNTTRKRPSPSRALRSVNKSSNAKGFTTQPEGNVTGAKQERPLVGLSDPRVKKLQAQSMKLEKRIEEQEARLLERVLTEACPDATYEAQTELSNLYASTIEAKMKVLEAVVDV